MTRWFQHATKLAVLLCCGLAMAQDGADLIDDFSPSIDVITSDVAESTNPLDAADVTETPDTTESTESLDVDALAPATEQANDVKIINVRLQDNGQLSGRLQVYYPTGKSEPADAKVAFSQQGQLVSSTRTDETGHFHLTGLEPGDYTATASVGEASTDFQVKILAFDENAAPEEMFLEGTLTPIPTDDAGTELIVDTDAANCDSCGEVIDGEFLDEEIIMGEECYVDECMADMGCECAPMDSGFSSCGTCGGGGGGWLGGLLGAGGLATGIAALAIDDDDDNNNNRPVSPSRP